MKILLVTSEAVPFAKTGGLADVAGAIPKSLAALGHEVALILPYYRQAREKFADQTEDTGIAFPVHLGPDAPVATIRVTRLPNSDVPVYLVDNPGFFDREYLYTPPEGDYPDNIKRFTFFAKAVLTTTKALNWAPDLYHCNDWQTALVPAYLKTTEADTAFHHNSRSVLTIHNLAYQGVFPLDVYPLTGLPDDLKKPMGALEFFGKMNLLKGGIIFADVLNTVSRRYAQEIQTEEFGAGLQDVLAARAREGNLHGIVNGIDYTVWNPAIDPLIPATYSPDDLAGKAICKAELQKLNGLPVRSDVPLIGLISRLDAQKGLDLVADIAEDLAALDLQFVLLGTGVQKFQDLLASLGTKYPDKLGINITFNNTVAHQIEAGSDIFLMPSRYEPCGLNQLYSLKYGTVPVVRKTGGLADTIVNCTPTSMGKETANGFSFESYSSRALLNTIKRALKLYPNRRAWRRLMLIGMRQDWSWDKSARDYLELYKRARA